MPLCDRNAPMRNAPRYARAQMPRANAPLCAQMPRARGRDCPYTRAKMPRYVRRGNNPLVFDLPVRVSVLEPPIIPQNAPIRRGN